MDPRGSEYLDPRGRRMVSGFTMRIFIFCVNIVRMIKSRRLRWAGHVARMEEGSSAFKMLTGIPAGNRSLGRPKRRWEHNIRMNLKEIGINTRN